MTPQSETWIIGDRRENPDRRRKLDEPVSLKVLATVLAGLILAFLLWVSTIASSSVVTAPRFEKDSARRDFNAAMQKRDVEDVARSTARTDTNVYRLCLMLAPSSRRGECR